MGKAIGYMRKSSVVKHLARVASPTDPGTGDPRPWPRSPAPTRRLRADQSYDSVEVAAYRTARRVSQAELARVLRRSQPAISLMETNAHHELVPAWDRRRARHDSKN